MHKDGRDNKSPGRGPPDALQGHKEARTRPRIPRWPLETLANPPPGDKAGDKGGGLAGSAGEEGGAEGEASLSVIRGGV